MSRLTCRRVVFAGAAAAVGLAALKTEAKAQTQTKPASVTPAELAKHEKFMRLAIAQANRDPGRPFGSVLVDERTGEVVAAGVADLAVSPMAHSELAGMNNYIAKYGNKGWENLTMYGTGEACPMCASAMVGAASRAWSTVPTRRSWTSTSPTSISAPRPSSMPAR